MNPELASIQVNKPQGLLDSTMQGDLLRGFFKKGN